MLYINDSKQPFLTYAETVKIALEHGVERERVYLYLMTLGVKGAKGRVMSESGVDYLPAVKLAVKDGQVVTGIKVCGSCKQLVVE